MHETNARFPRPTHGLTAQDRQWAMLHRWLDQRDSCPGQELSSRRTEILTQTRQCLEQTNRWLDQYEAWRAERSGVQAPAV